MRTMTDSSRKLRRSARRLRRAACLHHVVVGSGEYRGRCLDCRADIDTPFTIHSTLAA